MFKVQKYMYIKLGDSKDKIATDIQSQVSKSYNVNILYCLLALNFFRFVLKEVLKLHRKKSNQNNNF
jgi:hypothetical protein